MMAVQMKFKVHVSQYTWMAISRWFYTPFESYAEATQHRWNSDILVSAKLLSVNEHQYDDTVDLSNWRMRDGSILSDLPVPKPSFSNRTPVYYLTLNHCYVLHYRNPSAYSYPGTNLTHSRFISVMYDIDARRFCACEGAP